ncbi:hypothetical protein [Novispirillum itersonii]|uniref:hypothetical protein n=1 Tax=Novispirillum itersonii TaxID=189 RepID=UPI0003A19C5D|nr:hypothetical protein [Novispirillum itersonii]
MIRRFLETAFAVFAADPLSPGVFSAAQPAYSLRFAEKGSTDLLSVCITEPAEAEENCDFRSALATTLSPKAGFQIKFVRKKGSSLFENHFKSKQ